MDGQQVLFSGSVPLPRSQRATQTNNGLLISARDICSSFKPKVVWTCPKGPEANFRWLHGCSLVTQDFPQSWRKENSTVASRESNTRALYWVNRAARVSPLRLARATFSTQSRFYQSARYCTCIISVPTGVLYNKNRYIAASISIWNSILQSNTISTIFWP